MSYNKKSLQQIYDAGQINPNEIKRNPSLRNYKKENLDLLTVDEPAPAKSYSMGNGILGSYDGIYFQPNRHSPSGTSTGGPFLRQNKPVYQHRDNFKNYKEKFTNPHPKLNPKADEDLGILRRGYYGNMPYYIPRAKNKLLKGKFFTPFPGSIPLPYEQQYQKIPDNSMFLFAKNKASLNCRGTYTTDRGYVCTTGAQRKFVAQKRGNNKNHYDDSF